jgi:hypothetical protein
MQYPQPADSGNHSGHFLKVLELGGVSTNVYLRRIHNFALDTNWLSWSILPKHQWPKVKFKEKRAITFEEHQRIIAAEVNPERKCYSRESLVLVAKKNILPSFWAVEL